MQSASNSYTWSRAFVLWEALPSIAIAMPPSMHKVVAVAATEHAGLAFWQQACTQIPVNAAYIAVQMGRVVDYFRRVKMKMKSITHDVPTSLQNHHHTTEEVATTNSMRVEEGPHEPIWRTVGR